MSYYFGIFRQKYIPVIANGEATKVLMEKSKACLNTVYKKTYTSI